MERVREAPPSFTEESTPSLQALPAPPQVASRLLLEQLEALRGPGVTPEEVEAFLEALATPRPAEEAPRLRADVMLDILDETHLCELTDGQGRRVGLAALEGLMALGYPYALEVTPEMLARARGTPPLRLPRLMLLGLGLAGLNVLGHTGYRLFNALLEFLGHPVLSLESLVGHAMSDLPLLAAGLLGPPVLSALAGWFKLRPVKSFFNTLQWLMGGLCVLGGWNGADLGRYLRPDTLLFTGVLMLLTVLCLTPKQEPEA